MKLKKGDEVVAASLVTGTEDVLIVTARGQSIRFHSGAVPRRSRSAGGVRGIRLQPKDSVVSMGVAEPQDNVLVVSRGGYGKCTPLAKYRSQSRGGSGILTFKVTSKTGPVAMARVVKQGINQEVMLVSAKAQVIRITLDDFRSMGRNTQGVIVWRDREPDDYMASIACFRDNGSSPGQETNGHVSQGSGKDSNNDDSGEDGP